MSQLKTSGFISVSNSATYSCQREDEDQPVVKVITAGSSVWKQWNRRSSQERLSSMRAPRWCMRCVLLRARKSALYFSVDVALCVCLYQLIKRYTSLCWLCCRTSVGPRPRNHPSSNLEAFILTRFVLVLLF